MGVVVGRIDAVRGVFDLQTLEEEELDVGPDDVVRVPSPEVAHDEGMLAVAVNRVLAFVAEFEAVEALAVRFVVLEAEEWQGADVALGDFAAGIAKAQD